MTRLIARRRRPATPPTVEKALTLRWELVEVCPVVRGHQRRTRYLLSRAGVHATVEATPDGVLRDFATLSFDHDATVVTINEASEVDLILPDPPPTARGVLNIVPSAQPFTWGA